MAASTAPVVNKPLTVANAILPTEPTELPSEYYVARWYAAYTSANHEKGVAKQLDERSVEHSLLLYESVRRWKDRRVKLQLPLFPGYLQVPGVIRLVGFNGAPTPLPDEEIESLRLALAEGSRAEPHPYLKVGRRVRITRGPLAGREGVLKRWKGDLRVVLSTELIQRSISVEVDASLVMPVRESKFANPGSRGV